LAAAAAALVSIFLLWNKIITGCAGLTMAGFL
jgi:hypothetical protein